MRKKVLLILLAVFFTSTLLFIQSCQKEAVTPQEPDLLSQAKTYYKRQALVKPSGDKEDINIRSYKPDWTKAKYTKTTTGKQILGVPLFNTENEYIELSIVEQSNGNIRGAIKRLVFATGKLSFFSGSGRLRMEGDYDTKTRAFRRTDIKGRLSNMGGELDEVIIYPEDPWPPFSWPPVPPTPNPPTDPIPPTDPGTGGGGGGSPASVTIPFNGAKVDPKKELKCFDKAASAKMTIYVQQPNENSRDMMGTNSVGHAFIGIKQGGVERMLGFYPNSPNAAVFGNQPSEIHDNSGEMYHVSISKDVTAAQLTNMINYINAYPTTYSLSTYNCTDFAIGVAQQGGIPLPGTVGTTTVLGMNFSGKNPGDLGQDIRNAPSIPANATRTTTKTNAPAKSGGCP